jgi:glyoxylase-like metal-dependent hydrolase (beta-lactamase superfamily II)
MKNLYSFLAFVLIFVPSLRLSAQQDIEHAVISTIKINDHIHLLQWSGAGNMLLLSGKDGNILIDDQFAPLSEKINEAIQIVSKGQVKFLFNTHYHGDHAGGNENFANMGATILAHENVRARLMGDSSKLRFAKTPVPSPAVALPVMTFKEGMDVHLNTEDIIIFHVDNAHTDGDAIFYLPKSNVIHTGDCFMKDRFPYIDRNSGGSFKGWIAAVTRILGIIDDKTVVMPGHGDLATKKDYQNVRDEVSKIFEVVKTHVNAGKTLDEILALKLTEPFDKTMGSGFIKGDALITNMFNEASLEVGWKELINGKDFSDWKASENKETWSVVDGLYQAVGKRSHLFYNGEYLQDGFKNFEIDVTVKTFKLANSGIYFHTKYQESGWPNNGIEIQVNNSHIGEGDYIELKRMASLYGVRNLYKSYSKDDEWMNVKARVENNRVQIWLNGLKTVDYVQSENPEKGVKRLNKGTFALQGHDVLSKMQYKSFKVRRLPDAARSDVAAPILGAWADSLRVLQGQQFAFIDLNPHSEMSAAGLTNYEYQTGINTSLVKSPADVSALTAAQNLPIFTGLKVNIKNLKDLNNVQADYVVGESTDVKSAQTLLNSGKIQIWAHKGTALNIKDAEPLLDLAIKNKVAIEIDNETKTPSVEIVKLAKIKGGKFTFSGLVPAAKLDASTYILTAIKGAGLNYKDLFVPKW